MKNKLLTGLNVESPTEKFKNIRLTHHGWDVDKDWYIYLEYNYNGTWKPRKFQVANKFKDVSVRKKHAEAILAARIKWISMGWNPIDDPKFKQKNKASLREKIENDLISESTPLLKALDKALEALPIKKSTRRTYKSAYNQIKPTIIELGYDILPISEFKRKDFKLVLKRLEDSRRCENNPLSNRYYNKIVETMRLLFGYIEKEEVIEYNPAAKMSFRNVGESAMYETLTAKEKIKVAHQLSIYHPNFWLYSLCIYHAGLRPDEVCALRVSDLIFDEDYIKIIPDEERRNSKTNKIGRVPMCIELKEMLYAHTIDADPNAFVFGALTKRKGIGNRGMGSILIMEEDGTVKRLTGAKRPGYFAPSFVRIKRDTATNLWRDLVMKQLKIHKKLYSLKALGADDKLRAGIDIDTIRFVFRHTKVSQTKTYAREITEFYKKEIIAKAVPFITKLASSQTVANPVQLQKVTPMRCIIKYNIA
ncbi:phage integrase family protein [Chitinophaga skermanii]|uniref:Phage integrase family protein n=1 Tax=Chitinophaga skermanii TaxID=331697 RepID=A0A327Q7W1_9BACT|nr:site-specific integrase [Chitinophaga skermanii]RAJ00490.1 phage integrase family protein [Chitinophaga skermanii]